MPFTSYCQYHHRRRHRISHSHTHVEILTTLQYQMRLSSTIIYIIRYVFIFIFISCFHKSIKTNMVELKTNIIRFIVLLLLEHGIVLSGFHTHIIDMFSASIDFHSMDFINKWYVVNFEIKHFHFIHVCCVTFIYIYTSIFTQSGGRKNISLFSKRSKKWETRETERERAGQKWGGESGW